MLQKTKSLLLKLLMLLCVACCAVALAFSLAGCSGVTVDRMEIRDGNLWVIYSDGTEVDLGKVQGEDGVDGETPEIGTVVEDVVIEGDTLTVIYTDGNSEEYTIVTETGVTVTDVEIVDGAVVVTYSDGNTQNLPIPSDNPETLVVSVVFDEENNQIVVTYDDGSTTNIPVATQPEEPETPECAHENIDYIYEAAEHDCTLAVANGYNIRICNDCGSAWFELIPAGHEAVEHVVPPTCYSEGYTVDICRYCGEELGEHTDIVPALEDHEWAKEGFEVAYPGGTLCEGGWMVYPCIHDCGNVYYEDIEATGHHVEDWTVSTQPTGSVVGEATGFCTECGDLVAIELPAFDDKGLPQYEYTITDDEVNCSEPMEAEFTYVDPETNTTITFTGTLPGGMHRLNGELYDDSQTITYTDESDLPEGMVIAGNSNGGEINCTTEGVYAVFTCSVCDRPIVVNVRVPHTSPANVTPTVVTDEQFATAASGWSQIGTDVNDDGIPVNAEGKTQVEYVAESYVTTVEGLAPAAQDDVIYSYAASCAGNGHQGFRVYYCSACEDVVYDIYSIPAHEWEYTSVPVGDEINITAKCANCTATGTIVLKDYTTQVVTEVSCEADGVTTYTGTVVSAAGGPFDSSRYPTGARVTVTATVPQTNHVHSVYGTEFSDARDEFGNYLNTYYVDEYSEMELAANSGEDCADSRPVFGVFECQDCGETIVIEMAWKHSEPAVTQNNGNVVDLADNDYTYGSSQPVTTAEDASAYLTENAANEELNNLIFVSEATCENPGTRTYICTECNAVVTDTTPALGHDVRYTFTHREGQAADQYVLTSTCANECDEFGEGDDGYIGTTGSINVTLVDREDVTAETNPPYAYVASETPATCDTPSSRTIVVVTLEDGTPVTRTFTETGDMAMHTLNGVLVDDTRIFDPNVTPGITVTGNYPSSCADATGLGVFTCEVCHQPIVVSVRDSHNRPSRTATLPKGKDWTNYVDENNDEILDSTGDEGAYVEGLATNVYYTNAASCEDEGQYLYYCSVCRQWITGTIASTGHDYEYVGYEWVLDEVDEVEVLNNNAKFVVTFRCAECEDEIVIELHPFNVSGSSVTLMPGFEVESFNRPTHNTFGNFIVTYTLTADDFDEGAVADDFTYELTLGGRLLRTTVGGDHYHYQISEGTPVDPTSDVYYWWDETTGEDGVVTRTYYIGRICEDCGEMYATVDEVVSGEDIPDSDLPKYDDAVAADNAAEEEAGETA